LPTHGTAGPFSARRSARSLRSVFSSLAFEGLRKNPADAMFVGTFRAARARNGTRGVKLGQAATIRQVAKRERLN